MTTTTTTEADLLAAIREDPDADGPRLVYADWLQERGDPLGEQIATAIATKDDPYPNEHGMLARFTVYGDKLARPGVLHGAMVRELSLWQLTTIAQLEQVAALVPNCALRKLDACVGGDYPSGWTATPTGPLAERFCIIVGGRPEPP